MAVLHSQGLTYRQIGLKIGKDHKTVKQHVLPIEAFLGVQDDLPVSQQQKNNDLDYSGLPEHFILFCLLEDPTRSVREISNLMFNMKLPFSLHKSSISKMIHKLYIKSQKTIQRPSMTEQHIEKRLHFAEKMPLDIRYTLPWFFTDECLILLNPCLKTVYHIPGVRTDDNIFRDLKKHPVQIMVWGGIAHNYKSPLVRVNGTINAEQYIQILAENNIIETLDGIYGHKSWVFQDDGAPPHRAKTTKAWLSDRCLNVSRGYLIWPPNSPDLNPQEQMWAILRRGLNLEVCNNAEELFAQALSVWDAIPMDVINRTVDSFSVRLLSVCALDGACLNGHRDILRQVGKEKTAIHLAQELRDEKRDIGIFIRDSRHFFHTFLDHWNRDPNYKKLVCDSYWIVNGLPQKTRIATKILERYPAWVREEQDGIYL
jgi:hypothetical protein